MSHTYRPSPYYDLVTLDKRDHNYLHLHLHLQAKCTCMWALTSTHASPGVGAAMACWLQGSLEGVRATDFSNCASIC